MRLFQEWKSARLVEDQAYAAEEPERVTQAYYKVRSGIEERILATLRFGLKLKAYFLPD